MDLGNYIPIQEWEWKTPKGAEMSGARYFSTHCRLGGDDLCLHVHLLYTTPKPKGATETQL